MTNRYAFICLALLSTLSTSSIGTCADANTLVNEGIALRKDGRDADALVLFRQAYALQPAPRTRAQIGLAELALGKFLEAETDLRAALGAATDPWIEKNGDALRTALSTVEDHLAWVTVETEKGAEIRVDGRLVGIAPLAEKARVVAGTVRVEVARPGELPSRREVDVAPRQQTKIQIEPPPRHEVPAPVPTTPKVPTATYVGAALVGFGVAAVGFGSYFGVRAIQQKGVRDDHCDANGCDPDGLVADRRARDAIAAATVGMIGGVAAVATGIVVLVRSRPAVSVQVSTGLQGTGIRLVGSF